LWAISCRFFVKMNTFQWTGPVFFSMFFDSVLISLLSVFGCGLPYRYHFVCFFIVGDS
jgi:hypothetical protein